MHDAYSFTMEAAENGDCRGQVLERIQSMVASDTSGDRFVGSILERELEISSRKEKTVKRNNS